MEIVPVPAEMFHADGRTDTNDVANCRFPQFSESVQKIKIQYNLSDFRLPPRNIREQRCVRPLRSG